MRLRPLLLVALAALAGTAAAQEAGISDNSFLIEEAYNQDPGVVQHISVFTHGLQEGDGWSFGFTQEWPLFSLKHQVSYSIPFLAAGEEHGFGDAALNYRYQAVSNERLALAPRLSLLLGTGDEVKGFGGGGTGWQVALPASLELSERWVAHANAGATLTPHARNGEGDEARAWAWNLGGSLIWRRFSRVHLMLETAWTRAEEVAAPDRVLASDAWVISPGVRWSYDFKSGLQIVPGIAVPLGVGPSEGERALLVYLSFEHPFRKQ